MRKKKTSNHFIKTSLKQMNRLFDPEPINFCMHSYLGLNATKSQHFGYSSVKLICKLSGRPRSVIRKAGVARTPFKVHVHAGFISGISRSS